MSSREGMAAPIEITAENIGGIDRTSVRLDGGVNVLVGRNATNRTSLLRAIMAAFGSDRSTLKADAEEGQVSLDAGGTRLTRTLRRQNGSVVYEGEAYLEDPTLADLFAFLLEENEARRAVQRGEDLRELIMRPIDTAEIRARIRSLETEKRELDEELSAVERLAAERTELETERAEIEATIENREETLASLREELQAAEAETQAAAGGDLADLTDARADLETVEFDLETERETRRELEAERERLESELAALEPVDGDSPAHLSGRLEELRNRKRALDATVSELRSVIQFNEEQLSAGDLDLGTLETDGSGAVTDKLVDEQVLTCWTCGSTVPEADIAETLERLREVHATKLDERAELERRIDEVAERRDEHRDRAERRERLESRLEETEAELAATAERIAELEDSRQERLETVEALEARTEAESSLESVLETQREVTQVELELERHRERLAEVEERIAALDERLEEQSALEERRDAVDEELASLRSRVERIEADAVQSFNEHMDEILAVLEYENLERIWLERRDEPAAGRTAAGSAFDMHVVRTTAEGATYEDTVAHLSESEREVTGLVFALAGYLAHEVYETVPVMLLDSLEAIDADRIADLVAYFEDYVDCLVVALLPEDAAPLPETYSYHREI